MQPPQNQIYEQQAGVNFRTCMCSVFIFIFRLFLRKLLLISPWKVTDTLFRTWILDPSYAEEEVYAEFDEVESHQIERGYW